MVGTPPLQRKDKNEASGALKALIKPVFQHFPSKWTLSYLNDLVELIRLRNSLGIRSFFTDRSTRGTPSNPFAPINKGDLTAPRTPKLK